MERRLKALLEVSVGPEEVETEGGEAGELGVRSKQELDGAPPRTPALALRVPPQSTTAPSSLCSLTGSYIDYFSSSLYQ